jgi:hypothetical protein
MIFMIRLIMHDGLSRSGTNFAFFGLPRRDAIGGQIPGYDHDHNIMAEQQAEQCGAGAVWSRQEAG